ncbi:hypothetical protein BLNAU_2216 [Blattamonas nauphoetae]|uniref:COPI associated protein n=1 Tax=Blattamonas nauphoetae TaxID=2049346 RepID=A0ABQ9YGK4_9EUKA|nr:hypothetical protein BLNAU_2216 [Blattamonas nauphoetae]
MSDSFYSEPTASEQAPITAQSNSQPITQYTAAEEKAAAQGCWQATRGCYTSKCMKISVTILVIISCLALIGAIGVLCPIILITKKLFATSLTNFLFAVYSLLGGLILILLEFRITLIFRFVPFLMSPTYRAIFLIFLGSLAMASFDGIKNFVVIGYVVGVFAAIVGLMQLILCCCDRNWKKQVRKDYQTLAQQSVAQSDNYPAQQAMSEPHALESSNQQSGGFAGELVGAAMSSQEGRQFASTAAQVAVTSTISSGNTDSMYSSMAANPQLQSMAADAAVSAAQNPAVQNAAKRAASKAFTHAMSDAYDRLFDDD